MAACVASTARSNVWCSFDILPEHRTAAEPATVSFSTSLPKGGAAEVDRRRTNKAIRKSMTALPFEQRRLLIDQSAKLQSSINEVIANDAGAIAAIWHSRWRVPGYNYRVDHKDRDLKVYAVRGCWALEQGLMNKGAGYTDDALDRPVVGITNTGSSYNPCHGNMPQLIEAVKRGVMLALGRVDSRRLAAGGV